MAGARSSLRAPPLHLAAGSSRLMAPLGLLAFARVRAAANYAGGLRMLSNCLAEVGLPPGDAGWTCSVALRAGSEEFCNCEAADASGAEGPL
eukprot:10791157-Heterocapsa_arctica.AAC.1